MVLFSGIVEGILGGVDPSSDGLSGSAEEGALAPPTLSSGNALAVAAAAAAGIIGEDGQVATFSWRG